MNQLKRKLALILAILTLTAALGACGGGKVPAETIAPDPSGSSGEKTVGGEITVGIAQDLDSSLDPHKSSAAAGTREVLFNVFEGLVKPDTDGNLIPAVASEFDISESGDTFTFTLREGVRFHNGQNVTVGDIVYSISRAAGLDTGEPLVSGMGAVESVEATGDSVVVIKIKEPSIEFLAYLTVAIIPEGYDAQDTAPVGTGPFKFVSRKAQENIVLERFDDYWGDKAYLDKVTYKIIDNASTLVMSLKSGAIDLCAHLTSSQVTELGNFTILEGTMNLVQAVYLNNKYEPLANEKVRQALSYAINRQEIMDILSDGRGSALGSSMYPAFGKYFIPELTDYYAFSTEKAKSMLAEAGYPNGFDLVITVPSNYQPHIDTAQVVVEQLKAVGVNASIEQVEWATWYSQAYQGREFQATITGVDASTMTARALLERFTSTNAKNFVNFSDEEYDKTFAEALACTDEAKQTELYKRCETILTERAANLYIQDLCDLVAINPKLAGYEFYPLYVMDLSRVYYVG